MVNITLYKVSLQKYCMDYPDDSAEIAEYIRWLNERNSL